MSLLRKVYRRKYVKRESEGKKQQRPLASCIIDRYEYGIRVAHKYMREKIRSNGALPIGGAHLPSTRREVLSKYHERVLKTASAISISCKSNHTISTINREGTYEPCVYPVAPLDRLSSTHRSHHASLENMWWYLGVCTLLTGRPWRSIHLLVQQFRRASGCMQVRRVCTLVTVIVDVG